MRLDLLRRASYPPFAFGTIASCHAPPESRPRHLHRNLESSLPRARETLAYYGDSRVIRHHGFNLTGFRIIAGLHQNREIRGFAFGITRGRTVCGNDNAVHRRRVRRKCAEDKRNRHDNLHAYHRKPNTKPRLTRSKPSAVTERTRIPGASVPFNATFQFLMFA